MNRREFIRMTATIGLGTALAACYRPPELGAAPPGTVPDTRLLEGRIWNKSCNGEMTGPEASKAPPEMRAGKENQVVTVTDISPYFPGSTARLVSTPEVETFIKHHDILTAIGSGAKHAEDFLVRTQASKTRAQWHLPNFAIAVFGEQAFNADARTLQPKYAAFSRMPEATTTTFGNLYGLLDRNVQKDWVPGSAARAWYIADKTDPATNTRIPTIYISAAVLQHEKTGYPTIANLIKQAKETDQTAFNKLFAALAAEELWHLAKMHQTNPLNSVDNIRFSQAEGNMLGQSGFNSTCGSNQGNSARFEAISTGVFSSYLHEHLAK